MTKQTYDKKFKKAVENLKEMLSQDNLDVDFSDPESRGKSKKGDIVLDFKGRKYPISVSRKESMPFSSLEVEKDDTDILLFRKNRRNWKVYMDLNTLIMLMLNRRS